MLTLLKSVGAVESVDTTNLQVQVSDAPWTLLSQDSDEISTSSCGQYLVVDQITVQTVPATHDVALYLSLSRYLWTGVCITICKIRGLFMSARLYSDTEGLTFINGTGAPGSTVDLTSVNATATISGSSQSDGWSSGDVVS